MAHFQILEEVRTGTPGDWQLCFHYGIWHYDQDQQMPEKQHTGYRFIWRRPNGDLQGARGQARLLPELITILLGMAAQEGWYPTPPEPADGRPRAQHGSARTTVHAQLTNLQHKDNLLLEYVNPTDRSGPRLRTKNGVTLTSFSEGAAVFKVQERQLGSITVPLLDIDLYDDASVRGEGALTFRTIVRVKGALEERDGRYMYAGYGG